MDNQIGLVEIDGVKHKVFQAVDGRQYITADNGQKIFAIWIDERLQEEDSAPRRGDETPHPPIRRTAPPMPIRRQ
jgi:hypothetical protein